jgi:hypothetical protein
MLLINVHETTVDVAFSEKSSLEIVRSALLVAMKNTQSSSNRRMAEFLWLKSYRLESQEDKKLVDMPLIQLQSLSEVLAEYEKAQLPADKETIAQAACLRNQCSNAAQLLIDRIIQDNPIPDTPQKTVERRLIS